MHCNGCPPCENGNACCDDCNKVIDVSAFEQYLWVNYHNGHVTAAEQQVIEDVWTEWCTLPLEALQSDCGWWAPSPSIPAGRCCAKVLKPTCDCSLEDKTKCAMARKA